DYRSTPGKTLSVTDAQSDREFERHHYSLSHNGRWSFGTSDSYVQQEETKNVARDMTIKNTVFNTSWSMPLFDNHLATVGAFYNSEDLKDTTTNRVSDRSTAQR